MDGQLSDNPQKFEKKRKLELKDFPLAVFLSLKYWLSYKHRDRSQNIDNKAESNNREAVIIQGYGLVPENYFDDLTCRTEQYNIFYREEWEMESYEEYINGVVQLLVEKYKNTSNSQIITVFTTGGRTQVRSINRETGKTWGNPELSEAETMKQVLKTMLSREKGLDMERFKFVEVPSYETNGVRYDPNSLPTNFKAFFQSPEYKEEEFGRLTFVVDDRPISYIRAALNVAKKFATEPALNDGIPTRYSIVTSLRPFDPKESLLEHIAKQTGGTLGDVLPARRPRH